MKYTPFFLAAAVVFFCPEQNALGADPAAEGRALALNVPAIEAVTFAEHVAPIIFNNCTECHRPDEAAPFTFLNYKEVRKRGRLIKRVTRSGYMPPWHPVEGHGVFKGERHLSEAQIQLLARWADTGMAEGDPTKVPPLPEFTQGWQLGEPDLTISMQEAYHVPEGGPDIYRNFVLPVNLPEDKWVSAVEIRPSARTVVHHSLFYLGESQNVREQDARSQTPGFKGMGFRWTGSLGGWAVGAAPYRLPEGLAMRLPKGSDVVLQTHFHPSGKAEIEKTVFGIHFASKPPTQSMIAIQLPPAFGRFANIDVPAGEKAFKITDSFKLSADIDLITVGGHAHYICQVMKADATLPDGTQLPLFYIDDWDFNWQGRYEYKEPVHLPAGTVIDVELIYNNSADNPRNPFNPPQRIKWGIESFNEMGSITMVGTPGREAQAAQLRGDVRQHYASKAGSQVASGIQRWVRQLDRNGDGNLDASEIPERLKARMAPLDTNKDGVIDKSELKALTNLLGGRRRPGGR